ncbi:shikimate kinase [Mariniflexile ostreae]|uniref:Shikimate kinase n=1 Tax=Mariniflexile ostreae TaxID=1520892 RepID=A0ABV5FF24_9FLAO
MIFILIGYMASGKSTIGRILAKKMDYEFIDLDDFIEKNEKMPVSDIFKTKGEIYFRKKESEYLKKLISEKRNIVLSLGGGAPCYNSNMQAILNTGEAVSVYLKASIATLVSRLKKEKVTRPLVSHIETDDGLAEFIAKHLFERGQFYNLAHEVVSTDGKTENQIVEELVTTLL